MLYVYESDDTKHIIHDIKKGFDIKIKVYKI